MTTDAMVHVYDLALLQLAAHYDLSKKSERAASAKWLYDLYVKLVTQAVCPPVVLEFGAFSARFSRQARLALPEAQFHAIEANRYNHERFRAEVEADGVAYHHLAIGGEVKDTVLKIARTRDGEPVEPTRGNNSLRVKALDIEYEDSPVRMVTVDHFARTAGIAGAPCVLWIDLEGCSFEALQGAGETLQHARMVFIEMEDDAFWVGQALAPQVKRLLFDAGFMPVARDFEFNGQYNVIFAKPEAYRLPQTQHILARSLSALGRGRREA